MPLRKAVLNLWKTPGYYYRVRLHLVGCVEVIAPYFKRPRSIL